MSAKRYPSGLYFDWPTHIKDWLYRHDRSIQWLARQAGVNHTSVSYMLSHDDYRNNDVRPRAIMRLLVAVPEILNKERVK